MKLLIADDEDSIRNGITKYIQLHTDRFEKIIAVRNGEETLEAINRDRPEIMCIDIQMPLKNGIEVMEEAKRAKILPYTIVLSGYDEFEYCQKALRYGAKDYLLKPVRSSDILEKLISIADVLEEPKKSKVEENTDKNIIVAKALEYIEDNYYKDLKLSDVAERLGVTTGYLSTLISKSEGKGFVEILNEIRLSRACAYLKQGILKTYEIAYKVGFNDEKYFSKVFRKAYGKTPSEYKRSDED